MWHLSRYSGLFRASGDVPRRAHDPDVHVWAGTLANRPSGTSDAVGGAGWTRDAAELAGLGEAIERCQTHRLPIDRACHGSFARWAQPAPAIDPLGFALFHRDQYALPGFPFVPLARELELDWLAFRRVGDGERCWVPLELAVMDLRPGARHRFAPAISTGWAAHRTLPVAVLRAVQELIERDALMRAWWGACVVEEHAFADVVEPGLAERVTRPNLAVRCYRIASPWSDHVTMVTVAGEDREGWVFAIGSACRETRADSWHKALLEAVQGRHYVRYLRREHGDAPLPSPRDFREHALGYSLAPERLRDTVLARATPAATRTRDEVETLGELVRRLGPDRAPVFRIMTPPALAEARLDWCVVRVMAPGLQAMHGDHALPFLGGPAWGDRPIAAWRDMPPHPFA